MLAESPASGWLCPRSQCVAYGRARASSPTGSRLRFAALSSRLLSILPFFPPFVTTLHGRLDLPEHQVVFATFPSIPVFFNAAATPQIVTRALWDGLPQR